MMLRIVCVLLFSKSGWICQYTCHSIRTTVSHIESDTSFAQF